ncbi:MAG TPA: adenylate/guanylate cyclase domain-containing protein [Solirubrobacteraceae bacterium]|nr:adenylate/guanylate cyclase domain-containing protein [Solirubrobacteraceae bacterium]
MSAVAQHLERGAREAFAERRWERAYEQFSAADSERPLAPADLERLSEAACWTRRYDEMLELLERAEAGYERDDDARGAARLAMALVREHHQRNNDAVMGGWLARAAKLLEGEPECHETGLMMWLQVRGLLLLDNDFVGALEKARELVEVAKRLGDPDLEALGLLDQGHALIISGQVQDGSLLLDEATALAMTGATELSTAGTVYCSTIFACRNIGDWQRASQWTSESSRWCDRNSVSGFSGLCRLHRAEIIRMRGSLEDAEHDALAACEELMAWAPRDAGWAYHELGEVRRRRGDLEGARSAFAQALDVGFDPQPGLALLRLDEGDVPGATAAINRRMAERDSFTQEGRVLLLPAQIRIAIAAGDLALAGRALAELEDAAVQCNASAVFATTSVARGALALAEGRARDAVAPLREGWRSLCDLGVRLDAAQTRVLLGDAYRMTGDDADARLELEGARATFAELGAILEERRVDGMLAEMGGGVRETQTFVFTDIVDSTRLVELLGDDGWASLLSWHDRTVRDCLGSHRGREIKHEGDGFFAAFPDPRSALDFAIGLQRTLVEHRREHGFAPAVRIGIHAAQATRRGGDFIGRGVHVAARVGSAGAAEEILATAETMAAAGAAYGASAVRRLPLKGIAEPVETVEVSWR